MKVYIVLFGYDYEGFGEPEAVFATKEMAEAYVTKKKKAAGRDELYGAYEIFEQVVQ